MSEAPQTSPLPIPDGFDDLSAADKLRFLAELWERTESSGGAADLHDRVVGQVARARLQELRENPEMAISREEVMRRVRERLAR